MQEKENQIYDLTVEYICNNCFFESCEHLMRILQEWVVVSGDGAG